MTASMHPVALAPSQVALQALVTHLRKGEPIPRAWSSEHTLPGLWEACPDARLLLEVAGFLGESATVLRAACACARTVLHFVPEADLRPREAVDAAEAFSRGEMADEVLHDAAVEAHLAIDAYPDKCASYAAFSAFACAAAADDSLSYGEYCDTAEPDDAVFGAYAAKRYALDGPSAIVKAGNCADPELADLVRSIVPCPGYAEPDDR